jgi:transcriptional regulator with XRE-family HTH domain
MDFARSLKTIRQQKKLSLQELANLSGVSKSMLSKIERYEKNPTLQVAADIANALGVTLSYMLDEKQYNSVILTKKEDRIIYRDDLSGFQREQLSPTFDNYGIEFILYKIPPHQKSPIFRPHKAGINEYLTVTQGKLLIILDNNEYLLEHGDSIYFEANVKHQFINAGEEECHYYLVRDSNTIILSP